LVGQSERLFVGAEIAYASLKSPFFASAHEATPGIALLSLSKCIIKLIVPVC